MIATRERPPTVSATESLARFGRNINMLGALAIGGVAAVIPGSNMVLASWAALNGVQAGGFELWRQHARRTSLRTQENVQRR